MHPTEELVRKAINIPIDDKVGVLDVWGWIGEEIWGEFALSLEFWLATGALALVSFCVLAAFAIRHRRQGRQARALAGVFAAAGSAWTVLIFGSLVADRAAQVLLAAGHIEAVCAAIFAALAARCMATIDGGRAGKSLIRRTFRALTSSCGKFFGSTPCEIRTPHGYYEKTGTNLAFLNEGKKDGN